ncbi:hypothetical protein HG564_04325 [Helicobacter pylori]|nr:hypothetical protein [Helicobacter pylori]QQW90145.1 hypothetical protein HG564_04325 [Helicobacter pylori]
MPNSFRGVIARSKSLAFSLSSSLACLMPLLSSSMILSVLLVNWEFLALNSNCLLGF